MEDAHGDHLARYYTKSYVGGLLIELMSECKPRSLIDLGAGRGGLSGAAIRRWQDTKYVTIDIDGEASHHVRSWLQDAGAGGHIHYVHDVLDPNLPESVFDGNTFDASISNPPYLRPDWRPEFECILDRAGLAGAIASPSDVGADILFLAQSIRLTTVGGSIGLILPDAIVSGRQYAGLRRLLLKQHRVCSVVQLPRYSFRGTEAQAFIIVFKKGTQPTRGVLLQELASTGKLSSPLVVDGESAQHRMDYAFHAAGVTRSNGITLEQVGATIRRGTINATEARRSGRHIFHTSDFGRALDGRIAFVDPPEHCGKEHVLAEAGDILLARIDRNLSRKVALVVAGSAILSDCVYRIRVAPQLVGSIFDSMRSSRGERLLHASARGIGARLIGKSELNSIPFPV